MPKVNDIIFRIIAVVGWCGNNRTNTVIHVLTKKILTEHTVLLIQTILKEIIDFNQSILDGSVCRMEREIKHVCVLKHSSHTNQFRIEVIKFSRFSTAALVCLDITIECRNYDFLC